MGMKRTESGTPGSGADLEAQEPQTPRRDGIRAPAETVPRVQRPGPMRRHHRHQQAHQVSVIQIARLFEQEDVAEADEKQGAPCRSMIDLTIDRPRPIPSRLRE